MDLWMYWTTAVVFTALGFYFGKDSPGFKERKRITQETIDALIDMKYIRTRRDENDEVELVKYDELWKEEDL